MAFEKYTVRQYMNAKYRDDFTITGIPEHEVNIAHTEYIDVAGLFQSEEFNKVSYIHFLNNRINTIKLSIRLQKDFLDNFDIPYQEGFKMFKKFGHNLYWNNKEQFLRELTKIEMKENKYISQLEKNIKELKEERLKSIKKEVTVEQSRGSFIRTVNSLGKLGYKIDMDKTMLEEFAYMIKQQTEENEALKQTH